MVADKGACPVESPSCGWLVGWVAFDPMQVNLGLQSVHLIRLLDALQMTQVSTQKTPLSGRRIQQPDLLSLWRVCGAVCQNL